MTTTFTSDEYFSVQTEYWNKVAESDGFDLDNTSIPSHLCGMITGLIPYDCTRNKRYPFPVLVKRYAKLGLHRYNMLEGTRFELASLLKFNMLSNCVSSFYMTLEAHDPTAGEKTFQIRVDQKVFGRLDLMVSVARIKDEVTIKEHFVPHFHGYADEKDLIFKGPVPDWPSDDTLKDTRRFYILKESEWQDVDWIEQYLQLVICTHDKRLSNEDLDKMKIVKVAIQTSIDDAVPLNERLKAKRAILYIMFKGLKTPYAPQQVFEIGEHIERKAIVRRVLDVRTCGLTLTGMLLGGKRPSKALQSGEQAQSSIKRPRLASPRFP